MSTCLLIHFYCPNEGIALPCHSLHLSSPPQITSTFRIYLDPVESGLFACFLIEHSGIGYGQSHLGYQPLPADS